MNNLLDEEEIAQNRFRGKEKDIEELLSMVRISQRLLFLIIGIMVLNIVTNFVLFNTMSIVLELTTGLLFFALSKQLRRYPIGVMVLGLIIYLLFNVPQLSDITNLVLGVVIVFIFILGIVNGVWIRNKKRELGLK